MRGQLIVWKFLLLKTILGDCDKGWIRGGDDSDPDWIQLDLTEVTYIWSITTYGRGSADHTQFIKNYQLKFSQNGFDWQWYDDEGVENIKTFAGNTNNFDPVSHSFAPNPIRTRFLRLYPNEYSSHPTLRWEIFVCRDVRVSVVNGDTLLETITPDSPFFPLDGVVGMSASSADMCDGSTSSCLQIPSEGLSSDDLSMSMSLVAANSTSMVLSLRGDDLNCDRQHIKAHVEVTNGTDCSLRYFRFCSIFSAEIVDSTDICRVTCQTPTSSSLRLRLTNRLQPAELCEIGLF